MSVEGLAPGASRAEPGALTRQAGLRRATEHILFGLVPALVTVALIAFEARLHLALDLKLAYLPAASRLLHGLSPFAATPSQISGGSAFVYPALSALAFIPLALLGRGVAQILYLSACLACVPATLRALGVRDWRLYGVAMLWFPVVDGWQSGNVTLLLVLMVALAWRHRDQPWVAGLLTAAAISMKPFVWPLALWLLATRRWKAAAWALASGVVLNSIAWGVVGFNEISSFVQISSQDTTALWRDGYGMLAVGHHLGMSRAAGDGLLLAISVITAGAVIVLGAVRRRERKALVLAVVLMLLASPLLWAHYFALLLVPVALCRPRLSPVWALPLLMWPMPPRRPVHGWEEILAWAVTGAVIITVLRRSDSGRTVGHGS